MTFLRQTKKCRHWFNSINLATLGDGSNIPQIKHGDIEQLPVPLPPLAKQQKIVEEVEQLFSVADAVEKTIEENLKQAERLRHSILQKAFTGKLVPQDARDEPASILLERIKAERDKINAKKETKGKKLKETVSQKTLPFSATN